MEIRPRKVSLKQGEEQNFTCFLPPDVLGGASLEQLEFRWTLEGGLGTFFNGRTHFAAPGAQSCKFLCLAEEQGATAVKCEIYQSGNPPVFLGVSTETVYCNEERKTVIYGTTFTDAWAAYSGGFVSGAGGVGWKFPSQPGATAYDVRIYGFQDGTIEQNFAFDVADSNHNGWEMRTRDPLKPAVDSEPDTY